MTTNVTRTETISAPRRGQATHTIRWEWPGGFHEYSYHPGTGDRAERAASDEIARQEIALSRRLGGRVRVHVAGTPPATDTLYGSAVEDIWGD